MGGQRNILQHCEIGIICLESALEAFARSEKFVCAVGGNTLRFKNHMTDSASIRKKILLDLFQRLPTDYLLCAVRLACREWKQIVECEQAQRCVWQPRAAYFEAHALFVSTQCAQQQVRFESHREGEEQHKTTYSPLDRCLHYYARALLWSLQRRIVGSWMAHYYTSTGDMHRYWFTKHSRAQRLGDAFNEVDTELALQTVSTSRTASLDAGLQVYSGIPFTAPV